jgi:hypothetical protein
LDQTAVFQARTKSNVTMLDISPRQATTMIAGVGRKNDDHLTFM